MNLTKLTKLCKELQDEIDKLNAQHNNDILSVYFSRPNIDRTRIHVYTPLDLKVVKQYEQDGYIHSYCEHDGIEIMWCKPIKGNNNEL